MAPKTIQGKILCAFVAIWGIVLITLPIAVIGTNFAKIYSDEEEKNQIAVNYKKELAEIKDALEKERLYQLQKKEDPNLNENDYEKDNVLVIKKLDWSYHRRLTEEKA
jgi:hypothetical protein